MCIYLLENFVTDGVTVEFEDQAETEVNETTLLDAPISEVSAWEKPFTDYSVCEFLLLVLVILVQIDLIIALFLRKWGFPEW